MDVVNGILNNAAIHFVSEKIVSLLAHSWAPSHATPAIAWYRIEDESESPRYPHGARDVRNAGYSSGCIVPSVSTKI